MKVMRKQGKTFREISDAMTNSTRKKFPVSWVFKILTREENQMLLKVAQRPEINNFVISPFVSITNLTK